MIIGILIFIIIIMSYHIYNLMTKLKELNNKLLDEKNNDILTDNVQSLMKRKIDDLHIELKNLMKRIDDLNIESNQKSTYIQNLIKRIDDLNREIQNLMKRIDDLNIESNQKSTEIQNLMKRIDDLNIESNQKSTEINNLRRIAIELKNLGRPQFSTL